jgi:hypothetical protein
MKRFLVVAAAGLLLTVAAIESAWAFGTKDVLAMHRDGIADSLIIQKITYSGVTFHLDSADISALKNAGVSDAVISVMLETEGRDYHGPYLGPYWGPYYYGPYYPYYGPYYRPYGYYYRPYYPRVSLGFSFGHHRGFRHGHRF